ncbi:50S ribosomal protein L25/general stress protein Ctc [Bacillus sp. FJAT-27986]|uniref:50S ribosomal protein L25/general stress protein Ctc n=1 Tax=Bacillus sp. FJAT-27986 TaxID=1743146 RepID=UPI00080AF25F|nr:50S ribosomal protein L25/general stress protein Ctc [Bacillus sp. FJAT-27986]OCA88464.1 50S ribosomal protein L25/general stress protein Ctc [Bacillus sp. FJAT-27986]
MVTTLTVSERTDLKNSSLRKLRSEGNFPAVVYGKEKEAKTIFVEESSFLKAIKESGRNGVLSLEINGSKEKVMLTEYQQDPIKGNIVHADFLIVNMSQEMDVEVRIDLVGQAEGVKSGGMLQQTLHTVTVSSKPDDIPGSIEYDVSDLKIGDSIIIADLNVDGSYTISQDEDEVVASILPPTVEMDDDAVEKESAETTNNKED